MEYDLMMALILFFCRQMKSTKSQHQFGIKIQKRIHYMYAPENLSNLTNQWKSAQSPMCPMLLCNVDSSQREISIMPSHPRIQRVCNMFPN